MLRDRAALVYVEGGEPLPRCGHDHPPPILTCYHMMFVSLLLCRKLLISWASSPPPWFSLHGAESTVGAIQKYIMVLWRRKEGLVSSQPPMFIHGLFTEVLPLPR